VFFAASPDLTMAALEWQFMVSDKVRRQARSLIALYGSDYALTIARRTEADLRSAGSQRAEVWAEIVETIIAIEDAGRVARS
jgi:hypothetical protein